LKIAVISDVHGNLEALQAVLGEIGRAEAAQVLCLGDVVGYGPDPAACVRLMTETGAVWLRGNHDLAVLPEQRLLRARFRGNARVALDWSEGRLDEEARALVRSLPTAVVGPWGVAAHGTVGDCMQYVFGPVEAGQAMDEAVSLQPAPVQGVQILWLGHSHLPVAYEDATPAPREVGWDYGRPLALTPGRWLINPGSVGQPRDGDPRARWALLDLENLTVTLQATQYDYESTQAKMLRAGLPASLIGLLGPTLSRPSGP